MPRQVDILSNLMKSLSKYLPVLFLLVCSVLYPKPTAALPDQPEYLVKSAMIFKMLQYTHWPDEDKLPAIRLAFVGNEEQLYEEMQRASKNILVKNKPLIVFKTDIDSIDPQINQVIYLDKTHSDNLHKIANLTRRTGTLLLTNQAKDRHDLMVNFLNLRAEVLSFEVNRANIIFEKLEIDRDLLLLGGTEIDVAELFRETEQALQGIKQDLFDREMELKKTSAILVKEQAEVQRQKELIKSFRNEVREREKALRLGAKQLETLNGNINQVNAQLLAKQQELAERESRYTDQLNKLRDQAVKVAFLNEQIAQKQAVLEQTEERVKNLTQSNTSQKDKAKYQQEAMLWVYYILAVLLAVLLLCAWLYLFGQKTNRKVSTLKTNLDALAQISEVLTSNQDLNRIAEKLHKTLNQLVDAPVFLLGVVDKNQKFIDFPLALEEQKRLPPFRYSLQDEAQAPVKCVISGQQVLLDGTEQIQSKPSLSKAMQSAVYLPLIIGDKVLGCLSVQASTPSAYGDVQLKLLQQTANSVAIAVSNALVFAELQQQKRKTQSQSSQVQLVQKQLMQSEKLATLGMLTPKITSELNEPANALHSASYLMTKEIDKIKAFLTQLAGGEQADPEVLQAFDDNFADLLSLAEDAQQSSHKIKEIIDHVRAYNDLDGDEHKQSLPNLVDSTMALLQNQHNGIELKAEGHQQMTHLQLPGKLGQVFMNLLINACQAVQNRQKQEPELAGQVALQVHSDNSRLNIDIQDNGGGMNETTQQKLFEAFYTTSSQGTGLGLTISSQIVKELGGDIVLKETSDNGSVMSLSLPV